MRVIGYRATASERDLGRESREEDENPWFLYM